MFGKVVEGMEVIRRVERVGTADGKPSGVVKIVDSGETSQSSTHDAFGTQTGNSKIWRQIILVIVCFTTLHSLSCYCSDCLLSSLTRKKEKISQTCISRRQF